MCGIAGVIFNQPPYKKIQTINRMLYAISHRGPDDNQTSDFQNFECGVVRLAIEAIEAGVQPVSCDQFILGFNGEFFNYKQILKKFNAPQEINSEAKALLYLYKRLGESFIDQVQGQFAIFIFDKYSKTLRLFRDRFGIRPLFYHLADDKSFYFSSEIKGIAAAKSETFNLDAGSVSQVCMFWTVVGQNTIFSGVKQVPPGYMLEVKANGLLKLKRYWENPIFLGNNQTNKATPEQLAVEVEKAVKSQIHGEVEIGCYLSGGVDSAALAHYLAKNSSKNLKTFSLSFSNDEYDESPAQKLMQNFLGSDHTSVKVTNSDIANNFEKAVNHAETLLFRTAPVPMLMLSDKVSQKGLKVVFTGEGADEIFLGYDLFFENRIRRFWAKNKNSTIRPLLLQKLYNYLPQFKNSRYFNMIKEFYRPNLERTDDIFFSHFVRWAQFKQTISYFDTDFANESEISLINQLKLSLSNNIDKADNDARAQGIEIATLLSNYLLSSQGDRMTMANSVEGRYPFLCEELNSYMAGIPPSLKAPGIKHKKLFRDSMRGLLPTKIVYRPKIAYQAPEAKVFLSENHESDIAAQFHDNINGYDQLNSKAYGSLKKKLTHKLSSERMGFRENMAYIMGISVHALHQSQKKWKEYGS